MKKLRQFLNSFCVNAKKPKAFKHKELNFVCLIFLDKTCKKNRYRMSTPLTGNKNPTGKLKDKINPITVENKHSTGLPT